jgi:hypothetical protein
MGQGKTTHVAQLIAQRLDAQAQGNLIQLLLDVAAAMPAGTASELPELLSAQGLGALVPLVVAVLAPLPGDPQSIPPISPRTAELQALGAVAQSCLSPQFFAVLERILRTPLTAPAVQTLLAAGPAGAQDILAAVQSTGSEGRKALQVLARNVLTAATSADFDATALLTTLDGLVDPAQPGAIGALRDLLAVAWTSGSAAEQLEARQAIAELAGCVLAQDPDQLLVGYLYDVVTSAAVQSQLDQPVLLEASRWLPLLSAASGVLAKGNAAADAWSQLSGVTLRPDVAIGVLPELVDLLQSNTLGGVLGLLTDLLVQPCREPAPSPPHPTGPP